MHAYQQAYLWACLGALKHLFSCQKRIRDCTSWSSMCVTSTHFFLREQFPIWCYGGTQSQRNGWEKLHQIHYYDNDMNSKDLVSNPSLILLLNIVPKPCDHGIFFFSLTKQMLCMTFFFCCYPVCGHYKKRWQTK